MTFAGFPSRSQSTAIPNVFFSDLLPKLTDPAVLGVVLYALNILSRKKGFPRYITAAEIATEPAAAQFLAAAGATDVAGAVSAGFARAAELAILLPLSVEAQNGRMDLYFLNTPADRRGMDAARAGSIDLGRVILPEPYAVERSSIFALYESLIGTLSPLIIEELAEAERLYPADWLEAAFREAAAQNARSWRYVSRILERWAIEGPDHAKTERDPAEDDHYFRGKYGRILRERLKP
ncbi:MAG: DnaD domain protein [Chloroflexota bacterium]|nr:DnaD domain protein [Chloroflexota bacterium]